jgi:hypothetical protein
MNQDNSFKVGDEWFMEGITPDKTRKLDKYIVDV